MSSNDDFGIGPSLPRSSHTQILSEDERAARLLDAHEQAVKLFDMVTESDILRPGVRDSEATLAIRQLAAERFGVSRHWHKRIVRSGPNTLQPYQINPPDRTMTDDDIVFADFGPVFDNWEADFGRTWVIGNALFMMQWQVTTIRCSTCRTRTSWQFTNSWYSAAKPFVNSSMERESCFISPTPASGVAMCRPRGSM